MCKTSVNPLIAVPGGDPAGIGPEIVAKAIGCGALADKANVVVVGDKKIFEKAIKIVEMPIKINVIEEPSQGVYEENVLNLIDMDNIDMDEFAYGKVSGMCGKAAYAYIEKCIDLAMNGKVDAIATTPINKEALKAGDVNFIGHTEIFGKLTGTEDPLTMFEVHGIRSFFLTRHVPLRVACDMVKKERILDYVDRCTKALRQLGVTDGTMAIAGLNPHCGEHGLFGNEEEEIFAAVDELNANGYSVAGPIGADSVFYLVGKGLYNSVLTLYHDQGAVAAKSLDFERSITVTLGMPILRTSVDHGTAFDIAGKNIATEVSMVEAISVAAKYAPAFKK